MTTHLAMSMFVSKEDYMEARIKELEAALSTAEAEKAALMKVAQAANTVGAEAFVVRGDWIVPDDAFDGMSNALDALPAHLRSEAEGKGG